eukprot:TRINITY_DN93493_c0_g1_i1.p1 TRINITY_DN93493_c0_g1~~TRINITY_DN93493_c0_g1_i1.p1  ORF type:complete len:701 (+),score=101.70 TRINITY_DN93493_c0_g1_i1:63-2165(+)
MSRPLHLGSAGFPGSGFPCGPVASAPSLSTQLELQTLKERLAHEEQSAEYLRQRVRTETHGDLWQFRSPDGAPLHLRAAPHLDGPRTGDVLRPGDMFRVSQSVPDPSGITFLRLADGKGWAFDKKPTSRPAVSRRKAFFGGDDPFLVLCVPASATNGTSMPGPGPGQQPAHANVRTSVPQSAPSILHSRLPSGEPRKMPSLLGHGQHFDVSGYNSFHSVPAALPHSAPQNSSISEVIARSSLSELLLRQDLTSGRDSHIDHVLGTSASAAPVPARSDELIRQSIEKYRQMYLHGELEGFEILEPDLVFRPKLVEMASMVSQPISEGMPARRGSGISASGGFANPFSSSRMPSQAASLTSTSLMQTLQVRILAAHGLLNTDAGSFFGNKSDPYVKVRLGKEEHSTPTINNELNPVWKEGNEFSFALQGDSTTLELEVFNKNLFADDTLGMTSLSLGRLPHGRWQHQVDKLKSRSTVAPAQGDLEYEVFVGDSYSAPRPAPAPSQALRSSGRPPPPPPPELRPGLYTVVSPTAVYSRAANCTDHDIVGHVGAGEKVQVLETVNCASEARVRGLIAEPKGWIPLVDTTDGFQWIKKYVERKYLVDNTRLNSTGGGLAYRFSKDLEDRDQRPGELGGPPWGSKIFGEDEGDGWIRADNGRFLPKVVNGIPVLRELDSNDGGQGIQQSSSSGPPVLRDFDGPKHF